MQTKIEFRTIESSNWCDLEYLFEGRGGPGHCWCMVWRRASAEIRRTKGAERRRVMKAELHSLVRRGVEIGIIAIVDGESAGWVSVAPLSTHKSMHGNTSPPPAEARPWAISCFFVARRFRGKGLAENLLAEAVRHARKRGAGVIDAFPVDRDAPSYRFMGFVDMFERAGFKYAGMAGTRRHVMRLELGTAAFASDQAGDGQSSARGR